MAYRTLINPNFGAQNYAGNCLPLAQSVVGAGGGPHSATAAANATRYQHWDRNLPSDALAVLWFSHTGWYTDYRDGVVKFEDWGHVVIWSPSAFGIGRGGFYSSPRSGYGGEWFTSIAEVEASFFSTYRFWSEDLNGVRVCEPYTPAQVAPVIPEDEVTPQDKKDIAQQVVKLLLDTNIDQQGSKKGGKTTLRKQLAWMDHQWAATKRPLEWIAKWGPKIAAKLGVK